MKKLSLIKFITILSLSSTLLSAGTFSLEVTKQRDVLRELPKLAQNKQYTSCNYN